MSSAIDIQIVSTPNLEKIENFLNDNSYRETIEYSANFNTRLCLERRLRLPFLDPQTGIAQNHCNLYMDRRQRMPGFRDGQIYTYPTTRWRKSRRQYLNKILRPFSNLRRGITCTQAQTTTVSTQQTTSIITQQSTTTVTPAINNSNNNNNHINYANNNKNNSSSILPAAAPASSLDYHHFHNHHLHPHHHLLHLSNYQSTGASSGSIGSSIGSLPTTIINDIQQDSSDFNSSILEESSSLGGADTSDSKDSQTIRDESLPKEWFYDEIDINEMDGLEEPKSPDDEYDYDPRYGSKKRKKRKPGRKSNVQLIGSHHQDTPPRKGRPPGSITGGGNSNDGGTTSSGRGSGRGRGRRKNLNAVSRNLLMHDIDNEPIAEPPSFETAAAAVEHHASSSNDGSKDGLSFKDFSGIGDNLRTYRKYL